ncbi:MAG: DoxX family protein [Gammaproteobacteria bacterium]|nr:DoxX family protein [Gammaproteobacteria bacterium]MDH5728817.1 DoxX family protein [Gammaproteobacteria bacterium]
MKKSFRIILALLIILAISSGITKVLLLPQEVAFFATYGFTNVLLIAFGGLQIVGGGLMILPKTRMTGAIIVAFTFIVSLIVLILAKSITPAIITIIAILLLGWTIRQTMFV